MSSKSASPSESLLDELQTTLAHGTVARRVETLRRVTDLFITGAVDYSNPQIELFDDVFKCLIRHIETSAKALLARKLAAIDRVPGQTLRALAFDDHVEVAAPVLSRSTRLDDVTLIETARLKSQAHLMAVSKRNVLSGAVTDALLQRGNDDVVKSTISNPGAEFSERGFSHLLERVQGNDQLIICVGMQPKLPRHLYLKLIAKASAAVRARLAAAHPLSADEVPNAVQEATRQASSAPSAVSRQTKMAQALVDSLNREGRLDEFQVLEFAEAGRFDETNAAIATLAKVALPIAEHLMVETQAEGVMILAKVAGFSWPTVKAIINMRDTLSGMAQPNAVSGKDAYENLRPATAQQVLRFHRMQQNATSAT